jgi:molybdopterin-guanine dinucleotide biosynthesis protein A
MNEIGAIVLCGGESRRMGQPKHLLRFGPETLLQRVVRLVRRSASPIIVVAAEDQILPDLPPDVQMVRDKISGHGPLQGIEAGLAAMESQATFAYITSTDAPFLAEAWISSLHALISVNDVAIPVVEGASFPLAAVYRCESVLPIVRQALLDRNFRVKSILNDLKVQEIGVEVLTTIDPDLLSLNNMNTMTEYHNALRLHMS